MLFVGRDDLLARIRPGSGEEFRAHDLSGESGAGKTSVLRHLEDHEQAPRPILVNLEDFNPGHRGEHGSQASLGAVQGSFQHFSGLLQRLVRRTCSREVLARFQAEIADARNAEVLGGRVSGIEESMDEYEGTLGPQDLANAWRKAENIVADSFVAHWNAATTPRLLLLDNVDEIADQEIGTWMADLLPRLTQTTVVLTRTPGGPPFPLPEHAVQVFEIADLDQRDVRVYLDDAARLARHTRVSEFLERKVYEVSRGHPATLAAVYELLWGSDALPGTDPVTLLHDLPDSPGEKAAALVERVVRHDEALERALWAAAIPRRFDAPLLNHLLADPPLSPADQRRVFEALGRFTLTEKLLQDGSRLRLHSYIRSGLLQRMRRIDGDRFDALHARAAAYYGERLRAKYSDGIAYRYGEAFTYENPKWQDLKREWLYHLGHATSDKARRHALLEFTGVFLDAFWWWGSYIQFDFCDQLVTDLGHLARNWQANADDSDDDDAWPELEALHQALQRILHGYPLRSVKSKGADWDDVRKAFLRLEGLCGLQRRDARRLTRNARHVAALLQVFLAHTWRYPASERPEADQYYSRAADLFAQDEDWSEAWIAFERADLRLDRGEVDGVSDLWRHAAALVQPYQDDSAGVEVPAVGGTQLEDEPEDDEPDDELVSNLHRLRADCCWETGDHARSATWYGRAVLHAYLFHLIGGPPDDYTLQFYVDIRARALSRLFHLWRCGEQDTAVALAIEMARAFPTTPDLEPDRTPDRLRQLLAERTPVALARALFPRGPDVSELGKFDSPFNQEFDALLAALGPDRASSDLHDPVWP